MLGMGKRALTMLKRKVEASWYSAIFGSSTVVFDQTFGRSDDRYF